MWLFFQLGVLAVVTACSGGNEFASTSNVKVSPENVQEATVPNQVLDSGVDVQSAPKEITYTADIAQVPERGCENLAVSLVIDTSGSMGDSDRMFQSNWDKFFGGVGDDAPGDDAPMETKPTKIEIVQSAITDFLQTLAEKDQVSLIQFSSDAEIVSLLTEDKKAIEDDVKSLTASGNTNIVDGLTKGASVFEGVNLDKFRKVLFLLSDGLHQRGGDPIETASTLKSEDPDLKIITMGYELDDIGRAVMESIASTPKAYLNADDSDAVIRAFQQLGNDICKI